MKSAVSTTQLCCITHPFSLLHDFTVLDFRTINWNAGSFLRSATQIAKAGYIRRVAFVHNSNVFVIGTINALLWMRCVEKYVNIHDEHIYFLAIWPFLACTNIYASAPTTSITFIYCTNPTFQRNIILCPNSMAVLSSQPKPSETTNKPKSGVWMVPTKTEIVIDQSRDKLSESKWKL